jgi:transcriptional regulator with XRE-family HTH domain
MIEATLFGELVRAARKGRRLRIGQLAEKVNIGSKHLGRIENGEKQPSFELVVALAKALDVSPEIFFRFDDLQSDQTVLKEQLVRLLEKQDSKELNKAGRVLRAMLEP